MTRLAMMFAAAALTISCLTFTAQATFGHSLAHRNSPSLRISPHRASIGHFATVVGKNFPDGQTFFLMLSVHRGSHRTERALVPAVLRASSGGRVRIRVRMPVVTHCGRASLSAYRVRGNSRDSGIQATFILTGCTAPKHDVAPPPPPSTKP